MLLLLFLTVGCSTKKSTFTRRVYHNLTAHYNAYWNGNESLKEGVKELTTSSKDNYSKILPVYQLGSKDEAQKVNPQMDRAIEKAAKVIKMHSIFIKGKEHIRWIDDAYLMIGKANYYKQDYRASIRTFNFILSQFKNNSIKYDAMIWLARANNQIGEYGISQSFLDQVKNKINEGNAPKYLERDMNMAYAEFYIKQENYEPAIGFIIPAISQNWKKDTKTRLKYILAQIYQKSGELNKASDLYKKVIKKNPPYEMAFNAKINLAMCYDAKSGDSKDLMKKLTKMLKDQKNKEFLDQIYYAMAEVAIKNKDFENGINYLKLSVSNSAGNNYQKAVSALKLADIYFDLPDYENAQAYYDSTVMFLPKDFPNYELIKSKTNVLNELVKNIQVVKVQDSLQAMAKMKPDARDMKINNVIAQILKEEQLQKELENSNRMALNVLQQNSNQRPGANAQGQNAAGEWYFYNPSTMSFGFSEFGKKWGKRKLEDLWRISNKQTFDYGDQKAELSDEENSTDAGDTLKNANNPKNKNYYLKNLPLTDEKMLKSKEKVEEALFNTGYIYYEGLKDLRKSQETYDTLLNRFPEGKNTLKAYYQLYRIFSDLNNTTKRDYYKGLILSKYPESDYAKIISDPNYYKEIRAKNNEVNLLYEETYKEFVLGNYSKVIANHQIATEKFKITPIYPKFEYLKALSKGKILGKDTLVYGLNNLISTYPNHEIVPLAQMVLDYLKKGDISLSSGQIIAESNDKSKNKNNKKVEKEKVSKENKVEKENEKPKTDLTNTTINKADTTKIVLPKQEPSVMSAYNFNEVSPHFFILLIDANKVNINVLKIKISDFNRKFYSSSNLEINSFIYNQNTHIISVTQFSTADDAMIYYKAIKANDYIYSSISNANPIDNVISNTNFNALMKLKDIEGYQSFFNSIYLKTK